MGLSLRARVGLAFVHSLAQRSYKPDTAVWNFLPLFPDEETLVFQDQPLFASCLNPFWKQDMTGKAYRMTLKGELLWKAGPMSSSEVNEVQVGGLPGTWTDGGAALGPNGLMWPGGHSKRQLHPGTL